MTGKRQYDDGCAAAHALDLVGDRWALLVVRELLYGARRFSDLKGTLPGISTNVLTQRLKELEDAGVLRRQKLPPPAASWVYELTAWGRDLETVLAALRRWGMKSPTFPSMARISPSTGLSALKAHFNPQAAHDLDLTVVLTLDQHPYAIHVRAGTLSIEPGHPARFQVSIAGQTSDLRGVIFRGVPLDAMERSGQVTIQGDRRAAERFLSLFRPTQNREANP